MKEKLELHLFPLLSDWSDCKLKTAVWKSEIEYFIGNT